MNRYGSNYTGSGSRIIRILGIIIISILQLLILFYIVDDLHFDHIIDKYKYYDMNSSFEDDIERNSDVLDTEQNNTFEIDYTDPNYYFDVSLKKELTSVQDFAEMWAYMMINKVGTYTYHIDAEMSLDGLNSLSANAEEGYRYTTVKYSYYESLYGGYNIDIKYDAYTDNPERIVSADLTFSIANSDEEMQKISAEIDYFISECDNIIDYLKENGYLEDSMSQYDKALVIYKYIDYRYSYDSTIMDDNIYNALSRNSAVCEGYTYTYNYILNKLGIYAVAQYGYASNSEYSDYHVWTKVYDENMNVYYIDVTWGDPVPDTPWYSNEKWFWITYDKLKSLDPTREFFSLPEKAS